MIDDFIKIFDRDLNGLKNEIAAFQQEENLWSVSDGVTNSAGNLCLHLIGNLNAFIGKNMGDYQYIRNRDAEFHLKNIPKQTLLEKIDETRNIVLRTLSQMDTEKLEEIHPEEVMGFEMTNRYFLIHLVAHLSYHLGQINYLRRILGD